MHLTRLIQVPILVSGILLIGACSTEKSRNPLSPTIAGPIEGVAISSPSPTTPAQGALVAVANQPVTLVFFQRHEQR